MWNPASLGVMRMELGPFSWGETGLGCLLGQADAVLSPSCAIWASFWTSPGLSLPIDRLEGQ